MGGVAPDALKLLGTDVRQLNAVTGDYTLIYLNPAKVLFADTPVRRALGLAIDRAAIIQDVLRGQGAVAKSPIPPGSWAYDANVPAPTLDRAAAQHANDDTPEAEQRQWNAVLDANARLMLRRDGE